MLNEAADCLWADLQVLLMVNRSLRELPGTDGFREEVNSRGMLKVSSCQAFDYLLQAALSAQVGPRIHYTWLHDKSSFRLHIDTLLPIAHNHCFSLCCLFLC
jgi:hypothetical protein